MRHGQAVFVDSGAWIALALSRDPLHAQARESWDLLHKAGARLRTSVPVVIETFTFLDRNANRDVALRWKEAIYRPGTVEILPASCATFSSPGSTFDARSCTSSRPSMQRALRS